jgi:hypothetical protein
MLGKALFVCALVAVAVAIDSETMSADIEGTTELLQEHAKVEAKAKEGIQLGEKEGAKDTLTIWGKEVSMQKVQLAKKQLHHVMKHISVKRPQLLSSISTIQELTDHPELLGEGKLNGGYKKLRKVLWKIDQLEQELFDEWEMLRQQYEAAKKRCDDAWNASEDKLNNMIEKYEEMKRIHVSIATVSRQTRLASRDQRTRKLGSGHLASKTARKRPLAGTTSSG